MTWQLNALQPEVFASTQDFNELIACKKSDHVAKQASFFNNLKT